jgi:hypothetical protein
MIHQTFQLNVCFRYQGVHIIGGHRRRVVLCKLRDEYIHRVWENDPKLKNTILEAMTYYQNILKFWGDILFIRG